MSDTEATTEAEATRPNARKVREGLVVSTKMEKTIVVEVEMRKERVRRQRLSGAQHHREADLFAEPRIGDRDGGSALNRRMLQRQRLDPRRVDVVAAANDDVLLAAGDAQIAIGVERTEIAGHEPAVVSEG